MYDSGYDPSMEAGAGIGFFWLMVIFGVYFFFSYCMYKIGKKCGHDDHAWWGWIPILNTFLLIECAGKPMWHFVFALIPIVNIFMFISWWWGTSEKCGKPGWMGLFIIVPILNVFLPAILAFSSSPNYPTAPPPPSYNDQPRQPTSVG